MRLNLGANDRRVEGFISVDIVPPADQIVDLSGRWPWEDSSVEEVLALDVCEHIGDCDHHSSMCIRCYPTRRGTASGCQECGILPCYLLSEGPQDRLSFRCKRRFRHPLGRIHFMNELHRVLKSGARAKIETPNASRGCGYFQDPTHVSPWCLSSFKYFEHGAFARERLGTAYGITARFKVISLIEFETNGEDAREKAWKIEAVLEAVK